MTFLGQDKRVDHAIDMFSKRRQTCAPEFRIQKRQVERCVMDDDFRITHVVKQFCGNRRKSWLVAQKLARQAVDFKRRVVTVSIGIEVTMKIPVGGPAVEKFDAADFDDPMASRRFQPGRLGIEDDLSHGQCTGTATDNFGATSMCRLPDSRV